MTERRIDSPILRLFQAALLLLSAQAMAAQTITENFNGASTNNKWRIPGAADGINNAACLSAGNGSGSTTQLGACPRLTDTEGKGALRLTDAKGYTRGAIVSDFTFPSSEGIEVTFNTFTYGGSGADGITFFLADGSMEASVGALGGSLGYPCSNGNPAYNGVIGGYIGLGIDEFGNFLNPGDTTATGPGARANRIGLRGAGSISYPYLNSIYPGNYPSSANEKDRKNAIWKTCRTGKLQKGSGSAGNMSWSETGTVLRDYNAIPNGYVNLDSSKTPLWNQKDGCTNSSSWNGNCSRDQAISISYKLRITTDGRLSLWWSYKGGVYQAVLANRDIVTDNGKMPENFRFGFTAATGGSNNLHEITCFKAGAADISSGTGAANLPSGQYKTGAQIYIGSYNPETWAGHLKATNLVYNTNTGAISFADKPNWDASCVLTGGPCPATGDTNNAAAIPAPGSRIIVSWNGTQGVPFRWTSTTNGLTSEQKTALSDDTSGTNGEKRLNYLRGDRSNEDSSKSGIFRTRASVLGDIVNSGVAWVGPPSAPYPTANTSDQTQWADFLYRAKKPLENASPYGTFQSKNATRQNMVYIGANDGFLHGFRSGHYDVDGKYVGNSANVPNDGRETLAYMPAAIVRTIHNNNTAGLDYSSPKYGHNYLVDGTPGTGDLFYDNQWHTWLVGGLGTGGQAIYALDITDPGDSTVKEDNAAKLVIGEWAYSANSNSIWNNLGKTYGTPQIRRFHNGQWGTVFGNGYCLRKTNSPVQNDDDACAVSANGHAGIFVMTVNSSGAPEFRFLDTQDGTSGKPNGIAYVTPADLDGDHITDFVYAADLLGNLWRFDLTSDDATKWSVSSTHPLFTTPNQPITTQPTVSVSKTKNDSPRVIINFGTGIHVPQTLSDPGVYAGSTQTLYGIWDPDMSNWNAMATTKLAATTRPASALQQADLAQQFFKSQNNSSERSVGNNTVCWQGASDITGCTKSGDYKQFGWYANLDTKKSNNTTIYEQVIYNPIIALGAFIVNTTVPETNSPASCTNTGTSGSTIALDPATGSGLPGFFSGNSNDTLGYTMSLNATGSPSVINVFGQPVLITKDSSGSGRATKLNAKAGGARINWIQLR